MNSADATSVAGRLKAMTTIRPSRQAAGPSETAQMWARVGDASPVEPAPRRALDALLVRPLTNRRPHRTVAERPGAAGYPLRAKVGFRLRSGLSHSMSERALSTPCSLFVARPADAATIAGEQIVATGASHTVRSAPAAQSGRCKFNPPAAPLETSSCR